MDFIGSNFHLKLKCPFSSEKKNSVLITLLKTSLTLRQLEPWVPKDTRSKGSFLFPEGSGRAFPLLSLLLPRMWDLAQSRYVLEWDRESLKFRRPHHSTGDGGMCGPGLEAIKETLSGRKFCSSGSSSFSTSPFPAKLACSPAGEPGNFRDPRLRTAGQRFTQTLCQVTKCRVLPTQKN